MKILIATTNLHKLREYKAMLKNNPEIDILSLRDFPDYVQPIEDGKTFEENSIIKAKDAAKKLQIVTIADDTGLIVPALDNQPGVHSARYAGENATDKDNRKKLIKNLKSLPDYKRAAYFVCSITLCTPHIEGLTPISKTFEGLCEGTLLTEEKGGQGFGYDPLFVKHDYGKTFAELSDDTKNRISHRRKAMDKLQPALESIILEYRALHH